ncbi:MAG TPA: hypothetical protein VLF67_01950, partial [Candidatus Saccharimonas sp.]|nr:hypothetical protein [Candidatus Saccharimonas sp.]
MPFYYPEKKYQDWPRYLRNVVITVWVAVLVIFGIAVIARAVHVYDSHKEARQAATANDFWQQVAGTEPIADPSSRLGQLAQITRQLKAQPNPIRAFENYYIKPDSMGGVTGALGVKVAESHSGDITKQDEGAFTSDFILDALQANSDTVQDLMKPIPPVDDYGWASWQVLVGALVAIPGLGLL